MEIKEREVLKIQHISSDHPYAQGTKLEGKTYNRYAYGGKVFIAPSDSPFAKAFAEENVFSVDLDTNDDGQLSLVGYTTNSQEEKMAKTMLKLDSYKIENWKAGLTAKVEELLEAEDN